MKTKRITKKKFQEELSLMFPHFSWHFEDDKRLLLRFNDETAQEAHDRLSRAFIDARLSRRSFLREGYIEAALTAFMPYITHGARGQFAPEWGGVGPFPLDGLLIMSPNPVENAKFGPWMEGLFLLFVGFSELMWGFAEVSHQARRKKRGSLVVEMGGPSFHWTANVRHNVWYTAFLRLWESWMEHDDEVEREFVLTMLLMTIRENYDEQVYTALALYLSGFPVFEVPVELENIFCRFDVDHLTRADLVPPFRSFLVKLKSGAQVLYSAFSIQDARAFLIESDDFAFIASFAEADSTLDHHFKGMLSSFSEETGPKSVAALRLLANMCVYLDACESIDKSPVNSAPPVASINESPPSRSSPSLTPRTYTLEWFPDLFVEDAPGTAPASETSGSRKSVRRHIVRKHAHRYRCGPRDNWHYETRIVGGFYRGEGSLDEILAAPALYKLKF